MSVFGGAGGGTMQRATEKVTTLKTVALLKNQENRFLVRRLLQLYRKEPIMPPWLCFEFATLSCANMIGAVSMTGKEFIRYSFTQVARQRPVRCTSKIPPRCFPQFLNMQSAKKTKRPGTAWRSSRSRHTGRPKHKA